MLVKSVNLTRIDNFFAYMITDKIRLKSKYKKSKKNKYLLSSKKMLCLQKILNF